VQSLSKRSFERKRTSAGISPLPPKVRRALLLLMMLALVIVAAAACGRGTEDAALPQETEPPTTTSSSTEEESDAVQPATSADDTTVEGGSEPATEQPAPAEPSLPAEPEPPPTETAEHADDEAAHADDEAHGGDETDTSEHPGLSMYTAVGCAACHGDNAEGTDIGPALPGHSAEVILRQIRAPLGTMPAYDVDRLSDDDVDLIVDYITSLAPADDHVEPLDVPERLAVHHWMALIAIDAGDVDDAVHHVEHIVKVTRDDHKAAMQQAAELLRQGEVELAEDTIQDMLAGTADPELALEDLHLQLALSALEAADLEQAAHHLEDAVAIARGQRRRAIADALQLLQADELHDAEHTLQAMLSIEHG
jgi:mono/diheme cytochrome c family protein